MTNNNPQTNDNKPFCTKYKDKIIIACVILALALLLFIFYAAQASSAGQFFTVVGVSITIAGAALLAGGLLGFLFGIPKTLQSGNETTDSSKGTTYRANTNLEQISDWLTKILVGVSLTQLTSIPKALKTYGEFVTPGLGNFNNSKVFGIGILVLFLAIGFLTGFLLTRIFLASAFRHADLGKTIQTALEAQRDADAKALITAQQQLNPDPGEKDKNLAEISEAIKKASNGTKSEIFDQAKKMRSQGYNLGKTDMIERTIPIFKALIESDVDKKHYEYHGELGIALSDKKPPAYDQAKPELETAINIRGEWQIGQDENELYYESYLANCLINLDENFKALRKSDTSIQEVIKKYLRAAFKSEKIKKACLDERKSDIAVLKWSKINDINPERDI
ncbi:MAG: hypothetical protein ABR958_03830 [Dehalococcoidales bacterium]